MQTNEKLCGEQTDVAAADMSEGTFSKPKSGEPGLPFFRAVLLLICSNKPNPVENRSF